MTPLTQIKQIAVARPPEASPHKVVKHIGRSLSARPLGRLLLKVARAIARSRFISRVVHRVLASFAAPEHLTYLAFPAAQPAGSPECLTVITANLWHDWPRHRRHRHRLEAFARLVEQQQADVLLVQEVARVRDFRADEWLANRLGMAYVYGQANGDNQLNAFEEGVAVLSRFPLSDPGICYLAPKPLSLVRRLAVGVTVKAPGGDFLAVSAHLGHGRKLNTRQLLRLREWVQEKAGDRPAIVGGDFNTQEHTPQIRELQESWLDLFRISNPDEAGVTYRLSWPWGAPIVSQRLDYLFLRQGNSGWQVLGASATQTPNIPHSDHHAVVGRLLTSKTAPAARA